jgi:hypothetical protein
LRCTIHILITKKHKIKTMKNYNSSIRGYAARTLLGAFATGLGALVSGCPAPAQVENVSLPAAESGYRDTTVFEGDVTSADLSKRPVKDGLTAGVFDFAIRAGYEGQELKPIINAIETEDNGTFPFSPVVTQLTDANGNPTYDDQGRMLARLTLTDNDFQGFRDGAKYTVTLEGAEQVCPCHAGSEKELLRVTYLRGPSNSSLIDIINGGDTTTNNNYTIGDGNCSTGEPASSEDCTPSTLELLSSNEDLRASFVDAQGNPLYTITSNPSIARIEISSRLQKRLLSAPFIVEPQENGQSACIDVARNYSQPQQVAPGVFDTDIYFIKHHASCQQDEVAALVYSVTDKAGKVWQPIISEAALVPSTIPFYQP